MTCLDRYTPGHVVDFLLTTHYCMYRVIDTIADQVQFQQDLRNLEQWAVTWGMVLIQVLYHVSWQREDS